MFELLWKPKFYKKCKSCVKFINTRLEAIRKKRNAVQKFLKSDVAELLRSGLDYNAYERAKGLLVEQNMSSCYELIARFVGCIPDHLEDLTKQRDCPDECKEAVPSLMYAAARFADLPELRDLRTLFTEKFGNSLEPYISKEFVGKLRRDPPTKEKKIRLLYDIAQEFSIEWDGKALEQRLYRPPSLHEGRPKHDPLNNDYDDEEWHGNNDVANPITDNSVNGRKHTDGRDRNTSKGTERDTLSQGRKDIIDDDSWRLQSSIDDETSTDISSLDGRKTRSSSLGSVSENEVEIKRPFFYRLVPPPYLKQKPNERESKKTTDSAALPEKESNHDLHEPVDQKKPVPRSVTRKPLKPADERDEEERRMDGVSMHYNKKRCLHDTGKGKAYASQQPEYDAGQNRSGTCARGTSLPCTPTTSVETLKGHARSNSLHPNLPDCDDLASRLAALRGR